MNAMRGGLLMGLLVVVAACATTEGSGKRGDAITRAEIEERGVTYTDAYNLVEALRPQWLIKRGTTRLNPESNSDYIVVYEDGVRRGDPDALHTIRAEAVQEIRFLSSAEALRVGSGRHPHGAIVVTTRTR